MVYGYDWGGLGLSGIIYSATIQSVPIVSSDMTVTVHPFEGLDEYVSLADRATTIPYTVAWIDCLASTHGRAIARWHFMSGTHSELGDLSTSTSNKKLSVPFDFPGFALNKLSVAAFNSVYYNRIRSPKINFTQHYDPFFYPLDGVLNWNRICGRRGFYQYQCVVPSKNRDVLQTILDRVTRSGQASFLAVLKRFGEIPAQGMLSFPMPGETLVAYSLFRYLSPASVLAPTLRWNIARLSSEYVVNHDMLSQVGLGNLGLAMAIVISAVYLVFCREASNDRERVSASLSRASNVFLLLYYLAVILNIGPWL